MNRIDLAGRLAIVTGGAQGIGYAIGRRLLESGAGLVIWDRDAARAEEAAEQLSDLGEATAMTVDVTDPDMVEGAAADTLDQFGQIDILVNNAGIAGPNHLTWEYPLEDWHSVINVDLNGVFFCCRVVVPIMRRAGYGRIVNIASIAGKEGNPLASPYAAAKGGVIAFTKALGKELAKDGVLVNCVTPAAARTAIFDQIDQDFIDYMLSKIPMNRFVNVDEVAALVAWLASEDCSFSTGAVFDISGGRATY